MPVNQQPNQNKQDSTKKPPMRPDEYRPGDLPNDPNRDIPMASNEKIGKEHVKSDKSGKSDSSDKSCDTKKTGGKDSGCC